MLTGRLRIACDVGNSVAEYLGGQFLPVGIRHELGYPTKAGASQAITAATTAPVSLAWLMAQASAAFDGADPSTPTTIRCRSSSVRRVIAAGRKARWSDVALIAYFGCPLNWSERADRHYQASSFLLVPCLPCRVVG